MTYACQVDEFVSGSPGSSGNGFFVTTGIGSLNWSSPNGVIYTYGEGSPGIVNLPANTHMRLYPSTAANSGPFQFQTSTRMKWILRVLKTNFDPASTAFVRVGYMDDPFNATPSNGAYFESRSGIWWIVARVNGVNVLEQSSGVVSENTPAQRFYQLLQIDMSIATSAVFSINGVVHASIGSADMSSSSAKLNLAIQTSGTAVNALTDYVSSCLVGKFYRTFLQQQQN